MAWIKPTNSQAPCTELAVIQRLVGKIRRCFLRFSETQAASTYRWRTMQHYICPIPS
jgi:hypothetical protein